MTREEIEDAQAEILDEALDNIEANDAADPTPLIINVDTIPEDVTPTDFIDTWQSTGNTVVNDSGTSVTEGTTYRTDFQARMTPDQRMVLDNVTVTPVEEEQPVAVEPESASTSEDRVYGPMTLSETLCYQKEENKKRRQEKKEREMLELAKKVKQNDRKRLHQNEGYIMNSNDLMIIFDHRNRLYFQKTDTLITGKLRDLHNTDIPPCLKTGHQPMVITNGLIYDKNMNPLTISYSHNKNVKSNKTFNRINVGNTGLGKKCFIHDYNKWLVVNKTALISSGGKDFRVKHRIGYTVQETLAIKKEFIKQITEGKEFVEYLKSLIGQIYDEENYEIIYEYNFMPGVNHNNFHIYFQFPNLTISNSIEISHQIENLITRWRGKHYLVDSSNAFRILNGMEGLRTTFSAEDVFHKYSHS
ncbi:MAG: hypothetical protein ACTSX1_00095, partial [Candidatus Heimdallarchaeaceae archaeon]